MMDEDNSRPDYRGSSQESGVPSTTYGDSGVDNDCFTSDSESSSTDNDVMDYPKKVCRSERVR